MFLKELKIENKFGVIRSIKFHKGLNLIIDETNETHKQSTGNNVGKTTVLRLIDYCFGSDGKNIFQDTEFNGQENTIIKDFLIDTEVIISLLLVDDLENETERILIRRNFLLRKNKIQEINGENYIDKKDFDLNLKQLIFKTDVEKPTFRQIVSKNIRDEKNKLANIVKVLNPYTATEEYEALYLFWLGIDTDTHKQKEQLITERKKEEAFQKRLRIEGELSLIEQQLGLLNTKIIELEEVKSKFNFNEKFEEQIKQLNEIKQTISHFSTELSRYEMRRNLILESIDDLKRESSNIDTQQIAFLYRKASKLIPNLQTSFEETVTFHNDLIKEKIQYIEKELPEIEKIIVDISRNIEEHRVEEWRLSSLVSSSELSADYNKIIIELNTHFEQKGALEERKNIWINSIEKLVDINNKLDKINLGIYSQDELIQARIKVFNKYFSKISNELYGEEYLLSTRNTDKGYELIVTNIEGNPSTGKKKGQIAAFDFAYILFAEDLDITHLNFILHDQLENMHDNQLSTILINLANRINCQFILPIVSDKLPNDIDVEKYIVLKLSENDKLFKV